LIKGPEAKFVLYLDNSSVHTAAQLACESPPISIPFIYAPPYRPDTVGIEQTWAVCKRHYRKFVTSIKPYSNQRVQWDNIGAV